jgi:hypothetical protein
LIEAERKRLPEDVFAAQYEAQFVGVPVERCDTCLGPTPGVPTFVMIQGYDEPGTCPACGRLTDSEGRSIVPLRRDGTEGTPHIVRIVPCRGAEDPPEMPS